MSKQTEERRKTGRKFGEAAGASGGKGRAGKSGGKSRRGGITPVKVAGDRNWGQIALFTAVAVTCVAILGYTGYQAWYSGKSVNERVGLIDGAKDYRGKNPDKLGRQHQPGSLKYPHSPPVGGNHNDIWQNCQGDVYDKPIANEHAVHSLEHGAVWITYRAGLAKSEVDKLAKRVRGKDYTMMSPYKGLDMPISIQAWGYQLKVDSADDDRIDAFIKSTRRVASLEPGAGCAEGITVPGDKPRNIPGGQQPGQPAPGQPAQPGQPGQPAPPGGAPQNG
ncbi:MAG: DUF3105 domain-containing protein [Micromonosporaceae bacterium]|nr:DUF3105 domain-containing protein [Micromonosporaceae bacterium]